MAVNVTTDGVNGKLGDVVDFSVIEDATPLNIDNTDGSVGQLNISTRALTRGPIKNRSVAVIGSEITLTESHTIEYTSIKGYGTIRGRVTSAPVVGERINISAETLRARFHTDRVAKPFYGSFQASSTSTSERFNYFTNPSFEAATTGVTVVNTGTGTFALSNPSDGGVEGSRYATVTYGGAAATTAGAGFYLSSPIPAALTSYTFSGHFRVQRVTAVSQGAAVQRVTLTLRFYNASAVQVGTDTIYRKIFYTTDWERLSINALAPTGATSARLYFQSSTGTGYATWKVGDSVDIDAVMLEEGGLNQFFSGDTPNTIVTDFDGVVYDQSTVWVGTANASTSKSTLTITYPDRGYDATQGNYFRYLCELVGIPNFQVEAEFDRKAVAYPGWEGDVWTQLKKFCAAIDAEVVMVDDTVVLQKPRLRTLPVESISGFTIETQQTAASQFVEVINYNSFWGVDRLAYTSNTVYTVDEGETTIAEITVPHFIEEPNNPVPVLEFAQGYEVGEGQYMVLDSQDSVVDPTWWLSNGGRVRVKTVYNEPHSLVIVIQGPQPGLNKYVGPYKIGRSYGVAVPALHITGSGLFIDKQPMRIRTGVSPEQTSVVVGATIDNEFISNAGLAITKGLDAACEAAGPVVTVSGIIGNDVTPSGQSFGVLIGSRFSIADNIFRLTSANYTNGGIEFTGKADMLMSDINNLFAYTFAEFNVERGGITFSTFNTVEGATKKFSEFNAVQPTPTFTYFNTINDGVTFNTHAIFPNVNEVFLGESTI